MVNVSGRVTSFVRQVWIAAQILNLMRAAWMPGDGLATILGCKTETEILQENVA
ncbi:MAG TPA: hypothetical protein VMB25_23375 [Bryobacteraceae bacterium]|nr:hypothetical protein [Bryobacteraceae bacterium]